MLFFQMENWYKKSKTAIWDNVSLLCKRMYWKDNRFNASQKLIFLWFFLVIAFFWTLILWLRLSITSLLVFAFCALFSAFFLGQGPFTLFLFISFAFTVFAVFIGLGLVGNAHWHWAPNSGLAHAWKSFYAFGTTVFHTNVRFGGALFDAWFFA